MDKSKTITIGIFLAFLIFNYLFLSAPVDFPSGSIITVEQGMSLRGVSKELKQEHIIRSRVAFEAFVILYGAELHINYSDYLFENKLPVYEVARRIARGEHHLVPIPVTIPEGFTVQQIGETFAQKLPHFSGDNFLNLAKDKEGYLFPDTYFFTSSATEQDVLRSINDNFNKKIALIRPEIISSGRTEKEIIIMASIVEREAEGDTDRGFISGILWRRLKLGMPLQVDVAPETYKVRGLPKNPICNPGLEALIATIHPEKSSYLYYLHDKNGGIHYAKNFTEHQANIKKYLK